VTDAGAGETFMPQRKAADLLHVGVSTIGKLLADGDLDHFRARRSRRLYAGQVHYVAAQMAAGRTGSLGQFAREWRASRQQAGAVA
jgi:excisionase family DNA binding protein